MLSLEAVALPILSHFFCSVEETILINEIVLTLNTPETEVVDVLIEESAEELKCEIRIAAACCNCTTGRLVELVVVGVSLL